MNGMKLCWYTILYQVNNYKVTTDIKGPSNIPESVDGDGAEVYIECDNGAVNIQ